MHHQLTNKNYNIVFPLADYIVGTNVKPRIGDLCQMLYLGYLTPRSARVKAKVEVRRAAGARNGLRAIAPRFDRGGL